MEKQSPGEKQTETNRNVATSSPTTSAVITMATASSGNPVCTQAPSTSLSIIPAERQAVQVIQQAIHRPQSVAAQYLHQMYAAQQQHLMLQTAALQQHHTPHLQSLATLQQVRWCVCQRPSPSAGSLTHTPCVSQNSITLPASPVTAQLIGRTQASSSSAVATTISQQAMLLGNRPANCNQAQMYLRTQMLILTPAATVAAVQSDLPTVTSCSPLPPSSQLCVGVCVHVQNLALRAHLPGALAAAQSVVLKPSARSQILAPAGSLAKTSICAVKANQQSDTAAERGTPDVARLTSRPQILAPAAYSPVHTHTLVKQQLSSPPGQRATHHQLILQQAAGGASTHRHLQPTALRVAPQETNSNPLSLSIKRLTTPTTTATQSHRLSEPQTSTFTSTTHTSVQASAAQPQPPPLVAAPQRRTSFPQIQNHPPPPPPPLVLPRLPQNPPASLQRFSLHSLQALAMQSGQVLLTERELPVAEALVQMPYQNLPPPQTVAVDLKVVRKPASVSCQSTLTCKVNGLNAEERTEDRPARPQGDRTPATPSMPPKLNSVSSSSSAIPPARPAIRSQDVEEPPQLNSDPSPPLPPPPPPTPPLPPPILPAAVRGPSQPPSTPTSLPVSSDGILSRPQVLTHLIEGFVIREGLEPFPVVPTSLIAEQQASLPESQNVRTNGDTAPEDSPLDADLSDSTDSEMENDGSVADGGCTFCPESVAGVLQCEFCGSTGYAHTFLRSKRFCSMTCGRRFSVSRTKRLTVVRASHWGHRPPGRRGRPPGRVNGASRELRQAHRGSFGSEERRRGPSREGGGEGEDEPSVPMTTRLRKQAEREREREREQEREREEEEEEEEEQRMTETVSISDGEEEDLGRASQWNVQQVFSFINSLPGGRDIAEEFRSQEIDGQALLLLTEEHLVSTMNIKLGPALKLCAHINSLKEA
ncbi:polyhomeotic-like protein 3 [Genypterus blacodes]|uniref:polyhomeotic-like protein 3 n=1 Tax=Genypterus blacodes TaxID=154954 RepID=UPI003F7762DB